MKSFQSASLKEITSKLFLSETFDFFRLQEAVFSCAVNYSIDGKVNRDFYRDASAKTPQAGSETAGDTPPEETVFMPWRDLRPICFSMIRGKRAPLSFRLVFLVPAREATARFSTLANAAESGISSFVLVLQYREEKITATTAVSYCRFALDRGPEKNWDTEVAGWFTKENLPFQETA